MIYTYKKHFIDEEGNFKIGYYTDNNFQKFVDNNKQSYLDWVDDGNTPDEISYAPPSVEEKRATVSGMIVNKQNISYDGGFEFDGNVYPSDRQYREIMATGAKLGQKAIDNSETLELTAFTVSGTAEVLNQDQLVDIQETYDSFGVDVYNIFTSEMLQLPTAIESQLDYYIVNSEFE